MIVGVPKELHPGERRVALVPNAVSGLAKAGLEVVIEAGAGEAAGFPDADYEAKGAKVAAGRAEVLGQADILACVRVPAASEQLEGLREGQTVLGTADPLGAPEAVRALAERKVTLLALELLPRITRAQSMDVLSSQATVAGYKAVLLAATHLPRLFPLMMTAAGTIKPARVFVIGAGVAGLQAIGTAHRLGAVVHAYDIRPTSRTEVESLGARFVELPLDAADTQDKGGYAKAMDEAFYQKQRETMAKVVAQSDVVICTAVIPGKKAPVLVTEPMVEAMPRGGVVVDLAAERGGNCELSRPDETVEAHGVTVLGPTNLPATMAMDASTMYARNVTAFLSHVIQDGALDLERDDPILRETLVARGGEVVNERVRGLLG